MIKKNQLDRRFKERDIMGMSKLDLVYYLSKVLYWIWIPIGVFTNQPELFYILFVLGFLKFPIYHLSKKTFGVYNAMYPAFSLITLIVIFISWLF